MKKVVSVTRMLPAVSVTMLYQPSLLLIIRQCEVGAGKYNFPWCKKTSFSIGLSTNIAAERAEIEASGAKAIVEDFKETGNKGN